jgi:predicted nucleotidyltransferase
VTPDPRLAGFVELLRRDHGCHTLILYGSRARGDATDDSDYDLLGVRESGESRRDARWVEGAYLDAFIHPESKIAQAGAELLHVRGGLVLCEKDGIGARLLARLDEVHAAGPLPLPSDEAGARRAWAQKMVARARRGDLEGHYRRAWLLTALLEDYFLLRGLWYSGSKRSLAWLEAHAPDAHAAFAAALRPGADLDAIERLVAVVGEPPVPPAGLESS